MGRLIVATVLLCIVGLVVALILLPRPVAPRPTTPASPSDLMPQSFRTVAYILLVILLFGITTGWMGVV